ncbi:CHASE2 domain-containing protein [Qipengyuania sp. 6B39]|uniref:CHASE2 domain-containing protein n=1 Tax=Qipengyuania proteolytica TaxID=2867239 RepID=UPI001C8A8B04|nr:CHASE2 domain-containing protein [Qipengyuania proteolytica]MBX7495093.1 CHASE2 domain-containing protein [Qipengyuania proteolytica]
MSKFRLFAEWLVLLAIATALVVFAQQRELTQRLDLWILDAVLSASGSQPDPRIVIVEIDDRSLDRLGAWPWGRDTHAALVRRIEQAKPAVVGIDILFLDRSEEAVDADLASAIAEGGNVVLPHTFAATPDGSALQPVTPIAPLAEAAATIGHVAVAPDSDGSLRRFDLVRVASGQRFPHFAGRVAELAGAPAPVTGKDAAIVPFERAGSFPAVSAGEVLDGAVPEAFLRDRIVLVGATAQGLGDRYSVPGYAGGLMTGVETQANLLSAMLGGRLVTEFSRPWTLVLHLAIIAVLFIAFWRLSPRGGLNTAIALIAVLLAAAALSLRLAGVWLAIGPAIIAIIVAYPLWGWRRLAAVSRFLEAEVAALGAVEQERHEPADGFDHVARQVQNLKRLTGDITSNLAFVQSVLDASPDAMVVLEGDGMVSMTNDAADMLFGSVLTGGPLRLERAYAVIGAHLDDDGRELAVDDGRCFLIAKAPIDHSVGSEVLVFRDITRIKEDERQRRETLEFLSHDMRSPQVAIIGLTSESGATLGADERLARIEKQARRTLKLTDDFVQIARLSSEGIVKEETEINALAMEAADRAFPLAHRKQVKVAVQASDDLLYAHVDHSALSRALDNLVGNAIKFAPPGSQVDVVVGPGDGARFVLIVRDHGPGLPPERAEDPFARFGAQSETAGPSAGLGLAYCKQVVQSHGGEIEIDTAPGKGTKFRLAIPYS